MTIALSLINEPGIPVREAMDEAKMQELKASLRAVGLLQPIIVVRRDSRYEIVAGHRRYVAAKSLGWREIMAVAHPDGDNAMEAARLHENLFREDLSDAEIATFLHELVNKHQMNAEEICRLVRHSENWVVDRLKLLDGDPQVFEALRQRQIPFSVARELNRCGDELLRRSYLDSALRGGVNARTVADWVMRWKADQACPIRPAQPVESAAPMESAAAPQMECALCGGQRDPWNLVMVWVHRWELEMVIKTIREQAEGVKK